VRPTKLGGFKVKIARLAFPSFLASTFFVLSFCPTPGNATTIGSGSFSWTGSVDIFAAACGASCPANVTGPGIWFFNPSQTIFKGYDALFTPNPPAGSLLQVPITNGNGTVAGGQILPFVGTPTTGAFFQMDELTIPNTVSGLVQFDVTNISAGTGTNAACGANIIGNVCTPTGSPFTLTQNGTNGNGNVCTANCTVSITFNFNGVAYVGTSGSGNNPAAAALTSQVTAIGTISQILAAVASPQGLTNQSYSGSLTVNGVPEPSMVLMFLSGLGLIAAGKFARKS
jgi:hypothetical protein